MKASKSHGQRRPSVNVSSALAVGFLLSVQAMFAQGTFQNLDFEAAIISPPPLGYTPVDAQNPISAADALPGWTVRENSTVCTAVWGSPGLDITSVLLISGNSAGYSPLQGAYSVGLFANEADPLYQSASISQTGLIPVGAQTIQFVLTSFLGPYGSPGIQNLIVTLNGTPISISVISASGSTLTMAGDISAFAGTTSELTFKAPSRSDYGLDAVVFSSQAVPEPTALSLLGLGLLGLGLHRRRNFLP